MATTDTERYVRITLLTFEGGIWISKKILFREIENLRAHGSPSLDDLLRNNKQELHKRRDITAKQFETLFPASGADTDIDEWDLSLLIKIVKVLFEHSLPGQVSNDLDEILRIRNEVCHAGHPSLRDQEFCTHWKQLRVTVIRLASDFDVNTQGDAFDLIQRLSSGPLDLQSSIEKVAQLCRNDEHMVEGLAALKQRLSEVAAGVVDANRKLDDVLAGLRELLRVREADTDEDGSFRVEVPILNTTVVLSGKKGDVVKLAEDVLRKVTQSAIDNVPDQTDDENVRNAIQQFLADIESKGGTAEATDNGSIILKIRCKTLMDLDSILSFFRVNGSRYRMVGIENALSAMFQEELKVEMVLPERTLDVLKTWIDECLSKLSGKISEDGVKDYQRSIHMGIKCDSAEAAVDVIKYLQSDESANRLNQISEAVSEVVGDKIKVEAAPDVEGFSRALETMADDDKRVDSSDEAAKSRSLEFRGVGVQETLSRSMNSSGQTSLDRISEAVDEEATTGSDEVKGEDTRPPTPDDIQLKPGKPEAVGIPTYCTIHLRWSAPHDTGEPLMYEIRYKTTNPPSKKWKTFKEQYNESSVILTNLQSGTTFVFQVRIVTDEDDAEYSDNSDEISTKVSAASRMREFSEIVNPDDALKKRRVPIDEIKGTRNTKAKTRKFQLGNPSRVHVGKERTILLVGATGSGKSTLVDGFINYILGVSWEDPFRYTLVDLEAEERGIIHNQALSQTQWITTYCINPLDGGRLDYKLNIIDTPGFGDTRGIDRDQEIVSQLRQLFSSGDEKGVVFLDAVCFLAKAPDVRLTATQKYIFNAILALFGKDIAGNINIMITFADGKAPPVIAALDGAQVPYDKYFLFNNGGLFADNKGQNVFTSSPMFWEMGCKSFIAFFAHLETMQTKSLKLSKEVLKTREQVKIEIENITSMVTNGLSKVEEMRGELRMLEHLKSDIMVKRTQTSAEKEEKYQKAAGEKNTVETIIKRMSHDLAQLEEAILEKMAIVTDCNNKLKEVALRPDPLTLKEHIDILIECEKQELREGFKKRIAALDQFRRKANIDQDVQMFIQCVAALKRDNRPCRR